MFPLLSSLHGWSVGRYSGFCVWLQGALAARGKAAYRNGECLQGCRGVIYRDDELGESGDFEGANLGPGWRLGDRNKKLELM